HLAEHRLKLGFDPAQMLLEPRELLADGMKGRPGSTATHLGRCAPFRCGSGLWVRPDSHSISHHAWTIQPPCRGAGRVEPMHLPRIDEKSALGFVRVRLRSCCDRLDLLPQRRLIDRKVME